MCCCPSLRQSFHGHVFDPTGYDGDGFDVRRLKSRLVKVIGERFLLASRGSLDKICEGLRRSIHTGMFLVDVDGGNTLEVFFPIVQRY